jgi:hypothetical protein
MQREPDPAVLHPRPGANPSRSPTALLAHVRAGTHDHLTPRHVGYMIAGIAMFGVITATIAAYFVEHRRPRRTWPADWTRSWSG